MPTPTPASPVEGRTAPLLEPCETHASYTITIQQPGDSSPLPPATANEHQVGGDHYQGRAMQPWDIIEAWGLDFFEGSVLGYLLRRKPGVKRVDDLRKARHYMDKCIERELKRDQASY